MIVFGPVPSRRLGRSLEVNKIPPKVCSYSCAYCQLGRTVNMQSERQTFYEPEIILNQVDEKVAKATQAREVIDYVTFVPDDEPWTERLVPGVLWECSGWCAASC